MKVFFEAHIPHGSGDADYRLFLKDKAGKKAVIASVDPECIMDNAGDIAEKLAVAITAHDTLVRALQRVSRGDGMVKDGRPFGSIADRALARVAKLGGTKKTQQVWK